MSDRPRYEKCLMLLEKRQRYETDIRKNAFPIGVDFMRMTPLYLMPDVYFTRTSQVESAERLAESFGNSFDPRVICTPLMHTLR
ncbi:MAG: hypothetical protein HY514_04515 [Candidatus Aenigmarchaeota archaeon]|nr:hypothetical protein [Candidatus Aenigmarchaeota archaeon]